MPDAVFATRVELVNTEERLSAEIKENRENIVSNSKDIARLNTLYESLAGLPDAIVALDKTLFKMGESINAMSEKVNGVNDTINSIKEAAKQRDERISKIDNKSKIDWQTMITEHFWKILSALLGGGIVIQWLVNTFAGG